MRLWTEWSDMFRSTCTSFHWYIYIFVFVLCSILDVLLSLISSIWEIFHKTYDSNGSHYYKTRGGMCYFLVPTVHNWETQSNIFLFLGYLIFINRFEKTCVQMPFPKILYSIHDIQSTSNIMCVTIPLCFSPHAVCKVGTA